MRRSIPSAFALVLLAVFAPQARAQDAPETDLAARFAHDAVFYVEADVGAIEKGMTALDLVNLVTDPKTRGFFVPALERLEIDPKDVVGSLLAKSHVRDWLAGKAALCVRGLEVRLPGADGTTRVFTLSPETPLEAPHLYQLIGMWIGYEASGRRPEDPVFLLDATLVLDPGPAFVKQFERTFLADGADGRETVRIADRDVLRVETSEEQIGDLRSVLDAFYLHRTETRWILATTKQGMEAALVGPRTPLAASPRFVAARDRMTAGTRVLFAYADLEYVVRTFRKAFAELLLDMNAINGIGSIRGVAAGVSVVEGGVRESLGILLDGAPKGVWTVLDAFPGGFQSLRYAPPGALMAVAAKFDARVFMERLRAVAKELVPGAEAALENLLVAEARKAGFDLNAELLPAFGDEIALFLFPPRGMTPMPDFVVCMEVEDEASFRTVLEKTKRMAAAEGSVRFEPIVLDGGAAGFQAFTSAGVSPVFSLQRGHLFGATDAELLQTVLREWGVQGARTLGEHSPVFTKVLSGLNGGDANTLALLAYADMQGLLQHGWPFLGLAQGAVPAGWLDWTKMPALADVRTHLSGVAVGVRHDAHGLTLDVFSPAGAMLPSAVAMLFMARAQPVPARAQGEVMFEPQEVTLGLRARSSSGEGVNVLGLHEDGPAARAGIQPGDRIVAFDGEKVATIEQLDGFMEGATAGQTVKLTIVRAGATLELPVTLGTR